MATESTQNTDTQNSQATGQANQAAAALANNGQAVQQPNAGQVITVVVEPGQTVQFAFDLTDVTVDRDGDDLVLLLENGGKIVLDGFAATSESDNPPQIVSSDGSIYAGDVLVAQLTNGELETFGDAAPSSDGQSVYNDDGGDALAGLNAEGPLDPTPFPRDTPEPEPPVEPIGDDQPSILVTPPELVPDTPGFVSTDELPIELDGARGIVDEAALPNGSNGGSLVTDGTIEFDTGDDELEALEIMGTDGIWVDITNGGVVMGEYGTLVINPDYTWHYTLTTNTLDHNDTSTVDGDSDRGLGDIVLDGWTVRVTDDDGDSAMDTLTVAVTDDGPIAVDDMTTTALNTPVTYDVMANDLEGADASTLQGAAMAAGHAADGNVVIDANTGEVTFTPTAGFFGVTVVDYTIVDTEGDLSAATLTITIDAPPPPTTTAAAAAE